MSRRDKDRKKAKEMERRRAENPSRQDAVEVETKAEGVVVRARYERWGPLPTPEDLALYEQVRPGITEAMLGWVTDEGHHRRNMESQGLQASVNADRRGTYVGAILAAGLFSGAIFLLTAGHSIVGLAMIIAEIAALVAVFRGKWPGKPSDR